MFLLRLYTKNDKIFNIRYLSYIINIIVNTILLDYLLTSITEEDLFNYINNLNKSI
jgi:hypothetical protein